MLTEKESISDGFCKFFSSPANRLKKNTFPLTEITWRAKRTKVSFIRQQFIFKTVSDEEVLKHIKKLNRKSAMGLDEIPPLFLKDTAYVISKPLAHIINCSLMSGVVPNDFKRARVVPVYKSSAHENFDNYRPISVFSAISKILEKCVHSQLIEQLEKNNLRSQNQFDFRKYRSTELAAVWFTDQRRRSMDTGMLIGAIYVDMSKAFDTVEHAGIINKLPDYGITSMPQEWIINYLFNRSKQVTFQNTLFRREPTVCGVPQGSILGPLLFVLYIDDITTYLHQDKIVKYADDTVIFYSIKDAEVIQTVLNNEFSSMTNWLRNNELIINTKRGKTEVTLFWNQQTFL